MSHNLTFFIFFHEEVNKMLYETHPYYNQKPHVWHHKLENRGEKEISLMSLIMFQCYNPIIKVYKGECLT